MMQIKTRQPVQVGFSLVEMAIVMAIVALLLAGLLPTLSSQIEQQHRSDTRRQLAEIQQALIGYAITNGRLPCPADPTTPAGGANAAGFAAGTEYTTGSGSALTCANVTSSAGWGVLPWATLGISETDAWGRRFSYRVTTAFADAISANTLGSGCAGVSPPAQSSFALCSSGNLTILSAASGGTNVATGIPAVIVSHGPNGFGAYTPQGIQLAASTDADEIDNYNTSNTALVSHDVTPTFDDMVVWLSPNILFNRMVEAGKLP
jgi:prepilin-type N-terminal cleavage/methylation domain-containing protein